MTTMGEQIMARLTGLEQQVTELQLNAGGSSGPDAQMPINPAPLRNLERQFQDLQNRVEQMKAELEEKPERPRPMKNEWSAKEIMPSI